MKGAVALRKTIGTPIANDCSGVNITSGAYVQLAATLGQQASGLLVFNTSVKAIKLAIGGSGSEVDFLVIPPSTIGILVPVEIKKGVRLTAKALGADATTGYLVINFLA